MLSLAVVLVLAGGIFMYTVSNKDAADTAATDGTATGLDVQTDNVATSDVSTSGKCPIHAGAMRRSHNLGAARIS